MNMILVHHHGCVKYTLYKLEDIVFESNFFVRDINKCLKYTQDASDRSTSFVRYDRFLHKIISY